MTRMVAFLAGVACAVTFVSCGSRGPTAADATTFLATVNGDTRWVRRVIPGSGIQCGGGGEDNYGMGGGGGAPSPGGV